MISRSCAISCCGWDSLSFLPPCTWYTSMSALELAGADAHEGDAVPVGLVHVGLNLEDEGGETSGEKASITPQSAVPGAEAAGSCAGSPPGRAPRRSWSAPSRRTPGSACPARTCSRSNSSARAQQLHVILQLRLPLSAPMSSATRGRPAQSRPTRPSAGRETPVEEQRAAARSRS